ncbi:MAG TPA: nucleotidyltransferase [Saprospirales bacterium]|nr:nucleotidyltransferase [Saprospirales bacterium]
MRYPITHDKPKALAPFMGTTLLHYNLKFLNEQGVSHFVINTHHFQEKIESYLVKNDFFGLSISLSKEEILLDTAGGLANAAHLFHTDDQPILLFNADVITNLNIRDMLAYHIHSQNVVTLAVRSRKSSRQLIFDECLRMNGWVNHNTHDKKMSLRTTESSVAYAFSGIHLINPGLIRKIEQNRIYSLIDFYLENMDTFRIKAFIHDKDYWFDCGKPEDLATAENFILSVSG